MYRADWPDSRTVCWKTTLGVASLMMFLVCWTPGSSAAQGPGTPRAVPREDYFLSFRPYYDGEYSTAARGFRSAAKSGVRSSVGRWVDSICYHTMLGECYYNMGELTLALEQYDAALKLYLANRDWMLRIKFPPDIRPSSGSRTRSMTWAQSQRNVRVGQFPDTMPSLQGTLDPEQVLRQGGGVISSPNYYPVNVKEIVRCLALAIRRRTELMGPTCPHSALTGQLLTALARKPAPPNHWSMVWANLHLGLAYVAAGRQAEAVSELSNSLLAVGQYDHPLTGTALLELGKLALQQENFDAASNYFLEATFSAAAFDEFDVMREAFAGGYLAHRISGKDGIYPPLARATLWARRSSRSLEASLFLLAAENCLAIRESKSAADLLDQARRAMLRRDMQSGQAGARGDYLAALLNYQVGKVAAGDAALASCLAYQRKGSHRLFQIALSDSLYASNVVTDRVAMGLYDEVLREPTAKDWSLQPMETITEATSPNFQALEHWFEVAMSRKEFDRALEISDQVRRRRFYSSLAMGGRLLSLRWVLEAPEEALSNSARLQRQDLQLKYPKYMDLSRLAKGLRTQLRQLPMIPLPDQAEQQRTQEKLYADLAQVSVERERMLREIALQREPCEFVFPPQRSFKELQAGVEPGQIVLSFFATKRAVYAFAFSQGKYANWQVEAPAGLRRQIVSLLKQMGHMERNQAIKSSDLRDDSWRKTAQVLFDALTKEIKPEAWDSFDQLVIVPDGPLWYVPFQALQVKSGDGTASLFSKARIRLAPTVGLTQPDGRGRLADARTAIVWGELFPKADAQFSEQWLTKLKDVLPGASVTPLKPVVPSNLFKTSCDRLLVMRDIDEKARGPYDWSPLQADQGKPGASLASWMELPWGGPREAILPGFHTAAEDSLRRGGTGDEIFLSACGLMATGARTLLLSRWRVGGQTSQDLVREFVQELPHTSAVDAWQRSIEVVSNNRLDPELEPRLKLATGEQAEIKASHPFFWAGYMLIDTGSKPN